MGESTSTTVTQTTVTQTTITTTTTTTVPPTPFLMVFQLSASSQQTEQQTLTDIETAIKLMAQTIMGVPDAHILSIKANETGYFFITLDAASASAQKYNAAESLATLQERPDFKIAVKGAIYNAEIIDVDGKAYDTSASVRTTEADTKIQATLPVTTAVPNTTTATTKETGPIKVGVGTFDELSAAMQFVILAGVFVVILLVCVCCCCTCCGGEDSSSSRATPQPKTTFAQQPGNFHVASNASPFSTNNPVFSVGI